jgi:hypothetical protein
MLSQTMNILMPQDNRLDIYPIFHFCPGTKEEISAYDPVLGSGPFDALITIPDNVHANAILKNALETQNLYRIGIATHMFADTFCHRDFTGWKDPFNRFSDGQVANALPTIGHAEAGYNPDIAPLIWEDLRLKPQYRQKHNKTQILKAVERIFDWYCSCDHPLRGASSDKQKLLLDISDAIGPEVQKDSCEAVEKRKARYITLIGSSYVEYVKTTWLDRAIRTTHDPYAVGSSPSAWINSWLNNYEKSDWYQFQDAVQQHHSFALSTLSDTFASIGIDLKAASDVPLSAQYRAQFEN